MKRVSIFLLMLCLAKTASAAPERPAFRPEQINPGQTDTASLKTMLGKPLRVVREGASREYYFYSLGEGSTMDATVSVRSGKVEYITYLCNESLKDVRAKYENEPSIQRTVEREANGFAGALNQIVYESRGRGYLYEPKTGKVRACMAWEPGRRFAELGH